MTSPLVVVFLDGKLPEGGRIRGENSVWIGEKLWDRRGKLDGTGKRVKRHWLRAIPDAK